MTVNVFRKLTWFILAFWWSATYILNLKCKTNLMTKSRIDCAQTVKGKHQEMLFPSWICPVSVNFMFPVKESCTKLCIFCFLCIFCVQIKWTILWWVFRSPGCWRCLSSTETAMTNPSISHPVSLVQAPMSESVIVSVKYIGTLDTFQKLCKKWQTFMLTYIY